MKIFEGNIKNYKGNMEKYEGIMKKYVPLYIGSGTLKNSYLRWGGGGIVTWTRT